MTDRFAPLLSALPGLFLSLTVSGAAAAVNGSVVGWGDASYGEATAAGAVNPFGTADAVAAGCSHSCAIQAGTGEVVC